MQEGGKRTSGVVVELNEEYACFARVAGRKADRVVEIKSVTMLLESLRVDWLHFAKFELKSAVRQQFHNAWDHGLRSKARAKGGVEHGQARVQDDT